VDDGEDAEQEERDGEHVRRLARAGKPRIDLGDSALVRGLHPLGHDAGVVGQCVVQTVALLDSAADPVTEV